MRYAIRTFTSSRQFENFLNNHLSTGWALHSWQDVGNGNGNGNGGILIRALFVVLNDCHLHLPEVPR